MNNYNRPADAGDRKFIYEGCTKLNASLNRADWFKEMVCFRPGRSKVRLERDIFIIS